MGGLPNHPLDDVHDRINFLVDGGKETGHQAMGQGRHLLRIVGKQDNQTEIGEYFLHLQEVLYLSPTGENENNDVAAADLFTYAVEGEVLGQPDKVSMVDLPPPALPTVPARTGNR